MSANVDPAVLRAGNLPEHELTDLRDALKAFTRAYAFLGQVMKFTDEELESLYVYGKLLLAKLKESPTESGSIDLGDTALAFIGHQAGLETSGSNSPGASSGEIESFTGEGRGGTVEEALMIKLSELISTFNAAHGIDLSQAESLLIYVGVPSHLSDDEDVQQRAADNTRNSSRSRSRRTTSPAPSSRIRRAPTSFSRRCWRMRPSPTPSRRSSAPGPGRPPAASTTGRRRDRGWFDEGAIMGAWGI
ncbi:hypothetical protein ACI79P_10160 [Blastococcus sp. SYSU DS0510]